ncbi:hypothetical protein TOPH_08413 [Tolypocladium ophioglossoides CBS 100239]|uniref:Uncharacterized protein n=1 Tax=Tolypocladium ophioglossoides (strain CBS 100239) TaxID=1163406 RepID=A0A0L0MZJ2_TOLOC|nr:hypothetical protein TOPH_08413 [Tolypocladium ophioglossoides CBS 100239]
MAANADSNDNSRAEGTSVVARRASQGAISFRTPGAQSAPRSGGASSAVAVAAAAGGAGRWGSNSPDPSLRSVPASSPENFWRLLPVSEGSRRNSAAAGDGQADAAAAVPPPSWLASTSSSVETVKNIKSPLTPFPPWEDGSSDGDGGSETELAQDLEQADVDVPRITFVRRRWALNTAIHGVVLVGQITVTLAVASVFTAIAVWKQGTTQSRFWDMLWNYVEPALGLVLAMCVGALAIHETRVLSTVAMLFLQALILGVTTVTSLAMWIWLFTQDADQLVKGVVVGCVAVMMGTAMFAFFRTVLVWWMIEARGERGGGGDLFEGDFADYGTFEE